MGVNRAGRTAALSILVVITVFGIFHRTILVRLGRLLVVDEPLGRADVVLLAADAFSEGLADAGDLVARGVAPQVAVFTVVMTTADHSRRVRHTLNRALPADGSFAATVHVARGSAFRPDDWWCHRQTLTEGVRELTKLFVDEVFHPTP
jgi:hypothetical protein